MPSFIAAVICVLLIYGYQKPYDNPAVQSDAQTPQKWTWVGNWPMGTFQIKKSDFFRGIVVIIRGTLLIYSLSLPRDRLPPPYINRDCVSAGLATV